VRQVAEPIATRQRLVWERTLVRETFSDPWMRANRRLNRHRGSGTRHDPPRGIGGSATGRDNEARGLRSRRNLRLTGRLGGIGRSEKRDSMRQTLTERMSRPSVSPRNGDRDMPTLQGPQRECRNAATMPPAGHATTEVVHVLRHNRGGPNAPRPDAAGDGSCLQTKDWGPSFFSDCAPSALQGSRRYWSRLRCFAKSERATV
jgi:hypothetical protein